MIDRPGHRRNRLALCLLAPGALSACGADPAPQETGTAPSEALLERSVSDEMLPYDTLRSQPPLARPSPAPGQETGAGAGSGPATEDSTTPEAEPAPAADASASDQPASSLSDQ